MGDVSDLSERTARMRRRRVVAAAALVALAVAGCSRQPGGGAAATPSDLARFASGAMKNLVPSATGALEPAIPFDDADGKPVDLKKFRGKVVVVNLWATWCGPCVTEMPTLAALQKRYEGQDLVVVPISEKPTSFKDVKSFIDVHPPLPIYVDQDFIIPMKLKVLVLPTTIIYDREGREVARLKGEAKWDSPEAIALIDHLLKSKS